MQVEALWLSAGRDRAGRSPGPPAGQWSLGVTPCGDSTAGQKGIWDIYLCLWLLSCSWQSWTVLEAGRKWCLTSPLPCPQGCPALTPLLLLPGDGPTAPGDLQWMLRPAPGHGPAPSGRGRGTHGAQQRSLSLPVHPDHGAPQPPQLGLENTKIKLSSHTSAEKLWGGGESCNSLSWMNEWIQDSNKTYQSCSPWRPPALQLGMEELPRGQTQPRDSLGLAWVQTLPPPTITPHATSCQQRWQQEAEPWSSRNLHLALPRGAG